ncbi:MAG: HAD hydrolase-like protein, partial [Clostridiales bacterium]|nr:HAD hydrolase-like protein [Clostridiales bacterium]
MIKYIIFDFDGTLADSGDISFKAMNKMAKKHKFRELDWSDIEKIRGMSVIERSRFMGVSLLKVPFLAPEFYSRYKEVMHEMDLHESMADLLKRLKDDGYGLVVISSNSESNIREFLHDKNISEISEVICSHLIFDKDKIINKFLKRKGLSNTGVIYVGDEIRDITACKKSGIPIIWVDWGLDVKETVEEYEPDFM